MPRDIKSEWLAALATVALLAFAVTFGLLLSVSDSEPEPTIVAENSNVDDSPTEISDRRTPTTRPETEAVTETLEPSETDAPTATRTVTSTSVPATNTPEETRPVRPTRTSIPTRTPTDVAPTDIPTDEPSRTPSNTPTLTATATTAATDTPTARPTRTSIPTRTATQTTEYVIVTLDFGIMPTPTPDEVEIAAFETVQADCGRPQGWVMYVVQPGDTLFLISLAVDSTVDVLAQANCINDPTRITAGDRLFLPQHPRGVVGGVDGLPKEGCNSPAAQISSPLPGQQVGIGLLTVQGNAYLENLDFYKLEIRRDDSATYNFLMSSETLVLNGVLGRVDLSMFEPGVYWLRLTLVDTTGNVPVDLTCAIPMLIE